MTSRRLPNKRKEKPTMGLLDLLSIVGLSGLVWAGNELITWFLVLRNVEYQRMNRELEKAQEKAQEMTAQGESGSASKKNQARKKNQDVIVADLSRGMQTMRMKSMFVTTILLIGFFQLVNSFWGGVPVARLPFEPFGFVTGLSHRGLEGDDMRECSATFIYVLSGMALRGNFNKYLNRPQNPGAGSMFGGLKMS
jgi:calcium load-activated calcium channel